MDHRIRDYFETFPEARCLTLIGPEDFPTLALESVDEPVVFVDGGVRHRKVLKKGLRAFAVGDGDSRDESTLDVLLPPVKNYSDLAYVLRRIPDHFQQIRTFGFMGGRLDHQIINFGEAHHFLRLRTETWMSFDFEVMAFSPGVWYPRVEGIFSLIHFEPCELRLEGLCEYQIKETVKVPPVTSLSLSNRGYGQIEIECNVPVFMLSERKIFMDDAT